MNIADITTPAELRAASCLRLCYSDEQLAEYLPLTLEELLRVPADDACWAIAGLLPLEKRVEWANACARRAKEYAASFAARAAGAADWAARAAGAADWAARAAGAADWAARAEARRQIEYRITIRYGAMLLGLGV